MCRRLRLGYLLITLSVVMSACTPAAFPRGETPEPTATLTPRPTAADAPTPTPSTVPPSVIPPTPNFLALPITNDFLFSPSSDPDCQLPCWQGLRVGESDRDDIQEMFDEVFGFNGTLDFFEDNPLEQEIPLRAHNLFIPGLEITGYDWSFTYGLFSIRAVVDASTGILQVLVFDHYNLFPDDTYVTHTPQQLIRAFGKPSHMYAAAFGLPVYEDNEAAGNLLRLLLVYDEGMTFFFTADVPVRERTTDGETVYVVEFCLDERSETELVYIFEPLSDGLEMLTPIQKGLIIERISDSSLVPAEEIFGMSIEEFTDLALAEDNVCVEIH